jgi:hypothetical protein
MLIRFIFMISIFFISFQTAFSKEKQEAPVVIKGEDGSLDLNDLVLFPYDYKARISFYALPEPEKSVKSLLKNPDDLVDIDFKSVVLEFDD